MTRLLGCHLPWHSSITDAKGLNLQPGDVYPCRGPITAIDNLQAFKRETTRVVDQRLATQPGGYRSSYRRQPKRHSRRSLYPVPRANVRRDGNCLGANVTVSLHFLMYSCTAILDLSTYDPFILDKSQVIAWPNAEAVARASTYGDMAIDAIDLPPKIDDDHRKQNVI